MKKTIVIAALTLLTLPAMASKARLIALNNASHLQDIQQIFSNASLLTKHGEWLTFEMGPNPGVNVPVGSPSAEGGFSRDMKDTKYGFYLGHHSSWVNETRTPAASIGGKTFLNDENAVNLFYAKKADLNWGVGLNYANSDKKTLNQKQSALGLNLGVATSAWDAALDVGLINTYKNDTAGASNADFKGNSSLGLNGRYYMNTMTFSGLLAVNGGKDQATATGPDLDVIHWNVGVDNSHKTDAADFFYGVNFDMTTLKNKNVATGTAKTEITSLPVFAGIEAEATSWMVLRASVTQNFILGTKKDEIGSTGDSDTISNNTVVAAGAGLKFNKLLVDGTLAKASGASATGALNSNDLLANAAVTYTF